MDALSSSLFSPLLPSLPARKPLRLPLLPISAVSVQENHVVRRAAALEERVYPPPRRLAAAALCDAADDFINAARSRPAAIDPDVVLAGNNRPVSELPPTECCHIDGRLPDCLRGAYIRNGPNPRFRPCGPYHLLDGDGMLHSLLISDGRPIFCSRYVKTYKLAVEEAAGRPVYPTVFSSLQGLAGAARFAVIFARALTRQLDIRQGNGVANTSVAFLAGRLLALWEADLPYAVRLTPSGDIVTVGRWDSGGRLTAAMTAHPKLDHDTGEVFAFGCRLLPPFLSYFQFDPAGRMVAEVPISSYGRPAVIHDFAVTKRFAVFVDPGIVIDPARMVAGGALVVADDGRRSRIGVIPRYASNDSEMRWFPAATFNPIHIINAWDDGDGGIVMVAPSFASLREAMDQPQLFRSTVELVRLCLATGEIRRATAAHNLEWGVINPAYTGRRSRYVYMARETEVVKLDLAAIETGDCVAAAKEFGPGCSAGEPFFVARDPDNPAAAEDDGYVVLFMHDGREGGEGESRFLVLDARSPELETVASVRLPARVPNGFHGMFVRERDLRKQWW